MVLGCLICWSRREQCMDGFETSLISYKFTIEYFDNYSTFGSTGFDCCLPAASRWHVVRKGVDESHDHPPCSASTRVGNLWGEIE
jgi:hypothetical protein